jgi:hypothetical protein
MFVVILLSIIGYACLVAAVCTWLKNATGGPVELP